LTKAIVLVYNGNSDFGVEGYMRVIAWILLILCGCNALKRLGGMFFADDAGARFLFLLLAIVEGISVYVALTYLYFAHTPFRWAIIGAAVVNGITAILTLFEEEPLDRLFGFLVKGFACVGFILML
jgi:hypothetical protein